MSKGSKNETKDFSKEQKRSENLESEVESTLSPKEKAERDKRNEIDGFPQDATIETPEVKNKKDKKGEKSDESS